jgi:Na+/melibiose symporter-like transporter
MFQIPYLSIGYEIEDNYHDRTKLSATREFFVLLGLFCSLSIPMIVELENKELVKSLVNLALISGFIGLAIFLFFVRTTKPKVDDKLSIKTILNLKNNSKIRKLFLIWFLNSLANVFPMILFVFFITYVLGGNDGNRQETLFYYFLFSVIGIPIWTLLSKKTNKVFTWRVSLVLSAIIFSLVLFLENGNFAYFIIISCLTGLCLGADLLIPLSIQADMIDYHRMKFKEDISGFIFSVITFLNKISFAIASIFVFGILGMLDFDSDKDINQQSKYFIIFSYAVIPIILKLTASHLLKRLNFTENELISIQKEINM